MMARKRKRQKNIVRTDTLENRIAYFHALGRHEEARVLEWLAVQISAPIDSALICKLAEEKQRHFKEMGVLR